MAIPVCAGENEGREATTQTQRRYSNEPGGKKRQARSRRDLIRCINFFREVVALLGVAGRSSGFRVTLLPAPSHPVGQWPMRVSSPVTAARLRRICTAFPYPNSDFRARRALLSGSLLERQSSATIRQGPRTVK